MPRGLLALVTVLPALAAQSPAVDEAPLPAAAGWRACRIHQADAGVWYAHIDQVVDAYGANEVIATDDRGRWLLLTVYSGKWTAHQVVPDGQWLAFTVLQQGQAQVGVMKLGSGEWWVLTRDPTRGPVNGVCWSADSARIYFDRFFDLHVMSPVQHAVNGALTGDPAKREEARVFAEAKLELAYAWLDERLAGRTWATQAGFSLADCAAAPALFYADWTHRIAEHYPALRDYRARLLARPSFARAVEEARPYRPLFPLGAPDRD